MQEVQILRMLDESNSNLEWFTKNLGFLKETYDHNYIANGFIVHNSTYRMYLRRGKQGSRVAKLIDSPNLPDNETVFFVTEKGVKDEEE